MILRQFASNQPFVLGAAPAVVVAMLLPAAWTAGLPVYQAEFPADDLFGWIYQSKTATIAIAMILIIMGSLLSNSIFNKHEFYNVPSFVLSLVYAGIGSAMCLYQCSLPALLSALFILIGLDRQLRVFRQTRVLSEYFECGFWYGMAAMFFPPFLALAAGMWISILFTRAFSFRENILPLLAFSVPFLYWLVWKYWNNELNDLVLFRRIFSFDSESVIANLTWPEMTFFILAGVTFVMALPRYLFLADRSSNKARSVKTVFTIMAVSMILSFGLSYVLVQKMIVLTTLIPLTFIAGYWFTNYRYSLAAPLVFYLLAGAIVIMAMAHYGVIHVAMH
ncbi:MAG: hypothetical protein ACKVOK_11790 [Flavobacteriales bacterium]